MNFPGIPGRGLNGAGGDPAGMVDQEQLMVKYVRVNWIRVDESDES